MLVTRISIFFYLLFHYFVLFFFCLFYTYIYYLSNQFKSAANVEEYFFLILYKFYTKRSTRTRVKLNKKINKRRKQFVSLNFYFFKNIQQSDFILSNTKYKVKCRCTVIYFKVDIYFHLILLFFLTNVLF